MKIRAGLARRREAGFSLGNTKGVNMDRAIAESIRVKKAAARAFAEAIFPVVRELQEAGLSLQGIARELNARGIPTRKGGSWTATTVRRILVLCNVK